MISIYFRESDTLLAKGKMQKNNRLKLTDVSSSSDSFLSAILDPEAPAVKRELLQTFFSEVRQTSGANDGVYIVLPDYAFKTIECVEVASDEDLPARIELLSGVKLDYLYWSVPVICVPSPTQKRRTVYAVEKTVIQRIVDLAGEAGLKISSVEPYSLAFLRAYGVFHEERIIMEVTKTRGYVVSYSPIGGFFKMDVPSLPIDRLAKENDPESVFRDVLQIHDAMALKTFSASNENIPVILQSEAGGGIVERSVVIRDRNKLAMEQYRLYGEPILFAEYIESDISSDVQIDWMANAGTFLQDIPSETLMDMAGCPGNLRISIESGNLLPQDVVINSKFWHWQQNMFKMLRVALVMLTVACIAELAAWFYFSSVTVPEALVQQYDSAKQESDRLEAEFNLLKKAEKDDPHTIEAYLEILKYRPSSCRLLEAKLGSQSGKTNDDRWITFKAVAKEPVAFQDFISELSKSEMFKSIRLEKLDDQSNVGYKSAEYSISKGKIKGK